VNKIDFRLSVDEWAAALSFCGHVETGKKLLYTYFGELSELEVKTKLLTAAHSLIARDLLAPTKENKMILAKELEFAANLLDSCDYSLRFTKTSKKIEDHLTLHFHSNRYFEHRIIDGVVHKLTELTSKDEIPDIGWGFLELQTTKGFKAESHELELALFDELRKEFDPKLLGNQLIETGMSKKEAKLLAEDFVNERFRGSVLRVEYPGGDEMIADEGFLILLGEKRSWIISYFVHDETDLIKLQPCSKELLKVMVMELLAS